MRRGLACLAIVLLARMPQGSEAAGLAAVKLLPGYRCALLRITDAQAHDPGFSVPILASPNTGALVLNSGSSPVIVHAPRSRWTAISRC